jgi:2-polyprenyl-3-methyl-5-hydroxy-6-metoxy-1,4-benzoquinol methylase
MARWAESYLGPGFERVLADGYQAFVLDVNRSQAEYERAGRYRHSAYDEVRAAVYDNPEYMERYHWGVYVTTFAWEHHLRLYRFFRDYFLEILPPEGEMLELGAGSGIWAMLALLRRPAWRVRGVDISATSVSHANGFVQANGMAERISCERADAVTHRRPEPADSVMSCFLLEHLERPEELIESLSHNLKTGGHAFVTAALSAAERDHIYEMRRESEVILLAEERGFRIVSLYSASPREHPGTSTFLPRSAAFVMQKRRNDVW